MITKEGRTIEPLITDNHTVHLIVHQEALGLQGNPLVEEHMKLHQALIEKYGPGGREETPEEMVAGREALPAGIPETPAPEAPPEAGGEMPAPEETALTQSLAEMGGL